MLELREVVKHYASGGGEIVRAIDGVSMILDADDYARAWGSADLSADHLLLAPGARPGVVQRAVARTLGADSPFAVETGAEREQRHYASTRAALARLTQIRTLVLVAAVLAMATAMGGALVAVGSFALVTLVAVAMIALPGYLAARVSPAVSLQD